jgi:UDPglucose 6-dehydrogenase/UDP-N-acetyl-D-mannosaminuronic acid dehydrogenase
MSLASLTAGMRGPAVVYDCWNCFDPSDLHLPAHAGYVALGAHGRGIFPRA